MARMATFDSMDSQIDHLRRQVQATEARLRDLKGQLDHAERVREVEHIHSAGFAQPWLDEALSAVGWQKPPTIVMEDPDDQKGEPNGRPTWAWPLAQEEYKRYGRQMIMPEVGLDGQLKLKDAKVLVVGVGGLGCPAAAYLAGAGVGTLGLVDGDTVEVSNLHRQIAHSSMRVDMSKVQSACEYLRAYVAGVLRPTVRFLSLIFHSLNPFVDYVQHTAHLTPEIAISIFEQYDLVLDCTDHPTSRYLISDACVLTSKPLVSASALKTEGQLIILNNPPKPLGHHAAGGPCYRCVFPKPPPAESVLGCGEGGILGPVVGVMGVLQALEAIKILTTKSCSTGDATEMANGDTVEPPKPTMLMFSAYNNPQFRTVRLRSRRKDCAVCSSQATITVESLTSGSLDYIAFCGVTSPVKILSPESYISAAEYATLLNDGSHLLIDVRDATQFGICSLDGSVNVPWNGSTAAWLKKAAEKPGVLDDDDRQRYVVCRLGNDSQLVTEAMLESGVKVRDVKGGFAAWRAEVNPEWPDY